MLTVERTHQLRADRAWLPGKIRRTTRLVTGAVLVGAGAAAVGTIVAVPATIAFWQAWLLGGAGVAMAGNRAGEAMLQRQLQRMARGEIELADVSARDEGEMVVVRGRIEVDEPLTGILVDTTGVYRRLEFKARGHWVHEAAIDFSLIDDAGERVIIEAAGARWLVQSHERVTYPAQRFMQAHVPPQVRKLAAELVSGDATSNTSIDAFEQVLEVGERVQVVGYKTTSPDATGTVVGYRSPPQRATLRSGPDLPLVITRIADLRQ